MGIFATISGILNILLGGTSFVEFVTIKSLKKKSAEEAKGAALENIDAAVETWKKIVNSLQEQIDKLLAQRASDAVKIEGLSEEVKQQNQRIEQLQEQVASMDAKVKSVSRLEKTVARYEKLMDAAGIEY